MVSIPGWTASDEPRFIVPCATPGSQEPAFVIGTVGARFFLVMIDIQGRNPVSVRTIEQSRGVFGVVGSFLGFGSSSSGDDNDVYVYNTEKAESDTWVIR